MLPPFRVKEVGQYESLSQIYDWSLTDHAMIPEFWEQTKGEGIVVLVVDTGSGEEHPDLKNTTLSSKSISVLKVEANRHDHNGHGTAVSGMIAAENNSFGVVGVAPNAKIIALKALDRRGRSSQTSIESALEYAVKYKPDIVNLSLGSRGMSKISETFINKLYDMNIPVVCASGNYGDKYGVLYPAKFKNTIAVASYNRDMSVSKFSSLGSEVEFSAPGEDVLLPYKNGTYAVLDGTSFAAPYVSGVIALLLSQELKVTGKRRSLTIPQIRKKMRESCIKVDGTVKTQFGLIDMLNSTTEAIELKSGEKKIMIKDGTLFTAKIKRFIKWVKELFQK